MTYLAQATIPWFTGLPTDVVTNTFHFDWGGTLPPDTPDFALITNVLANFYETIFPGSGQITMASYADPAGFRVRIYNLDDAPPRVPLSDINTPLVVEHATQTLTVPETAICLSYHAALISGTNPRRRRGRIYIGALGAWGETGTDASFPAPHAQLIANLADAGESILSGLSESDWTWVVYSTVNQEGYPVVGGWIDNAADTQRRRGNAPTVRTTWPS